ncbi:toxin-antitoxin system YwqK family antitoxin [Paracoccaceae bacterium]|nr:toxin-antitoxin system YwqK family antitoxin [Paracoccaceae bacterium]
MKQFSTLLAILFVSLLSSPSWSEGTSFDDLVKRGGIYYKKFTDVPFTGETSDGRQRGHFENGKIIRFDRYYKNGQLEQRGDEYGNGPWAYYYENGQLMEKGYSKNGKKDGPVVSYHENGQLSAKRNYKNGKAEGVMEAYHENGQLTYILHFKNNRPDGLFESYHENGKLWQRLYYKNGSRKGPYFEYHENGKLKEKGEN